MVKKVADQGYLGAIVPPEYGGAGLDYFSYGLVVEEIGRGDSSMRTVISVQTSLVCSGDRQVRHRGAEAEVPAQAVLGRVAGLLRPDRARHRLGRRQPEDARPEDRLGLGDQRGEDVDLDGQLRQGRADLRPDRPRARPQGPRVLSGRHRPARLQGADDRAQDGTARLRHRARSRSKTSRSQTTTCSARSATASKSRCPTLDSGRYSVAAGCVGICQGCVEESVNYAKEREQFGRPIASFQLVQAMIADMVLKTDASRMLVWRAGFLKDQGRPEHAGDLDRQAARHRGVAGVREHRDPGPWRRRLRRRPPGRALLPRRARHDAVRGNLADPEADHRARDDRHQRARSRLSSRRRER